MFNHLRKFDWILIIASILLVGFGLVSIYNISSTYFIKQIIFLGIGIILMLVLSFFDWRGFRENPYFILVLYFVCLLFLLGLFFFVPEIRGVKSWYKIGPVSFDPIGLTTIVLTILLAKFFSMRHIEMYKLSHIILSGFYVLLPVILIFFQPDLGSVLILIALWLGVLIISGIKLRHFLILALCGLLILALSWSFLLRDYQKERIVSFLRPQVEPLGINWSQAQSKIAIGSGGIFGQGLGQGPQTQYGFLSEPHTDFIFANIAEEFGLIGVSILIFLFIVLIWRIMKIAISAKSNFPRLFASGIAIILFSQIFIHIGMNLGILPVIGISLPLVSYGGSNLIAIFIGLGILQSIRTH
ncbi:rod shape-determining protein RodA [Patescibacteria group bacterium]|nr:rod shape-determining protein RodA [Patescibacteria group bacterium]MBU2635378.1 rod shape-determining protein RodA [Patescibacteria group bacterium]